jgi:hypothetical protein
MLQDVVAGFTPAVTGDHDLLDAACALSPALSASPFASASVSP